MLTNLLSVVIGTLMLVALLALPLVLPFICWRACRKGRRVLAILAAIATLGVWFLYYPNLPTGDNRVAELTTSDGWSFVVFQKCNYSAEPYTTTFYYRTSPTNRWHAFYMDHEDERWWSGKVTYDPATRQAKIYRGNRMVATFEATVPQFKLGNFTTTNSWILGAGENPGSEVIR